MKKALALIALRFKRTWPVMLAISVFATALGWVWWANDLLDIGDSERGAYDNGVKKFVGKAWFPWGKVERSDRTIFIAIDDKTFSDISANPGWKLRYGAWPYDRLVYADVLEYLHQAGAKQVIFDATIDEPKTDPTGDLAMGETLKKTGVPLYLGFNVTPLARPLPKVTHPVNHPPPAPLAASPTPAAPPSGDEQFPADDQFPSDEAGPADAGAAEAEAEAEKLAKVADLYAFPVEVRGGLTLRTIEPVEVRDEKGTPTGEKLARWPVPAIEPLLGPVAGWGLVAIEADEDGKMRKTSFAYTDGVNTYVTLPVAAAADAMGADKVILEPKKLTIGTRVIPIDRDGTAWIHYGGPFKDRFRSISLVDVLRLKARAQKEPGAGYELFKGKHVFIGGFALGTADVKATPLEQEVPAVVKQAETLENLLYDGFITDAPLWMSLLFTFFVCIGSVALVLIIQNTFVDIGWPVLLYVGFFLVTGSFLVLTEVHVLSAVPSLAGTIASVLATAWARLFADREREQMKEMFKAYMESDLVDLMIEQHELPKLDGEVKRITAYFSDIKGFSTFSERFHENPKDLMRLLNRYLSAVTPVLTKEGACIDKYIGDAVVALFGAPVSHEDHALRACKGALRAQATVRDLCTAFEKEGLPNVTTRIGLNTDELLVGNIGSAQLLDYTAIGDGMNLASRLEGANKAYGTHILMGENTFLDVKEHVVAREVDLVRVAGKHVATRVYELVGLKGEVDAKTLEVHTLYAEALVKYRARQFVEALELLNRALAAEPADGPSLTLKGRCEAFLAEPPPPEWDGVADLEK